MLRASSEIPGRFLGAIAPDLTTLTSDESRRDDALRERGIETARFPDAGFTLTDPVDLTRRNQSVAGELTLHGETQPIEVKVSAQRLGVVTVEDQGALEFKLRLRPAG